MHLNNGNHWDGKGGMGRVRGFSLLPTWGKSGQEFAPRHKEGTSKYISKKRVFQVMGGEFTSSQKGCGHASQCVYCANKRLCVSYK
jgi:hypothetical protein